jgi:hypothetical protein
MFGISTQAEVVISPAIRAMPVVTIVSQATRALVSCARMESNIASEIWSATLSGCPSETDSEVKRYPDMSQVLLKKKFKKNKKPHFHNFVKQYFLVDF